MSSMKMGKECILTAAAALKDLAEHLSPDFPDVVRRMKACQSNIIVCGVGKSRIIAEKISETLSSIGVASFSLCGLDALHGGLGRIRNGDLLLVLSSSGETCELLKVVDYAKGRDVHVVAITRCRASSIGKISDIVLEIGSYPQAGPHAVLPTTSTTMMLASPSISFPLRTVDGWSPRVIQGFRLFSGAGSTGGWNERDRRLGGGDQG